MKVVGVLPRFGPHPEMSTVQCLSCKTVETGTIEWLRGQAVGRDVGNRLREYLAPTVSEPVPDRLLDMLRRTDEAESFEDPGRASPSAPAAEPVSG